MPRNPAYEQESPKEWSPIPKKTYYVTVKEVHTQLYEVQARNPQEAKEIVGDGGGEYVEGSFEFSHALDTDTWRVVEKKT